MATTPRGDGARQREKTPLRAPGVKTRKKGEREEYIDPISVKACLMPICEAFIWLLLMIVLGVILSTSYVAASILHMDGG